MQRDDDAEDYGYDLAHEEIRAPTPWEDPSQHDPEPNPRVGGKLDLDEDFGYDEAHDL